MRYENEKLKPTNSNLSYCWNRLKSSGGDEVKLKYLELNMSTTESTASENESLTRVPKPSLAESKFF